MKKILIILITVAIGYCIGFALGRNEIIIPQDSIEVVAIDYKEAYFAEKEIASAALELLHRWYSNDDNDYWFDVVVKTPEYQRLDSALNQDWEDFYFYETPLMWESIEYYSGDVY